MSGDEAAFRRGVVEALGLAVEMAAKLGNVDELVTWCRQQAAAAVGPCPVCREPRGHHRDVLTGRFIRQHDGRREGLLW